MMVTICLKNVNTDKVTLVELVRIPDENETIMISPTEIVNGPQPDGQTLAKYIPARTIIKIVENIGEQNYFGKIYTTLTYISGSL